MNDAYARRMTRVKPSAIRELLQLAADPAIISFAGGYPDPALFPVGSLDEIFHEVIANNGRVSLQYTVSMGLPRLRQQLAERLTSDGILCSSENVLILQGAQQGLDIVGKMLIDKGDHILVENPTFLGALIAFNPYEPEYTTVPMNADGMSMDALEECLKVRRPKFIYTVPDFHNPTGVSMSLERRRQLISLANRFDVLVVEDSPYRELRYEGERIPTLKSMDSEGRVIHLGSFSKVLAPGLRIGWAVASEPIINQLGLLKLAADTQCSTINMSVVSAFLDRFDADAQIAKIRQSYRCKKQIMLNAIRAHFPPNISCTNPDGGMFTWITFPIGFDSDKFLRHFALPEARVAYVPGATFFACHEEPNHARMSFVTHTDETIVAGISALGEVLSRELSRVNLCR
jgi:2-aminoadipate transaminase